MGIQTPWGETGKPGQGITNAKDPGPVPEFVVESKLGPAPGQGNVFNSPQVNEQIVAHQQLVAADSVYLQAMVLFFKKLHEWKQAVFFGKPASKPYFGKSFTDAYINSPDAGKDSLPYGVIEPLYSAAITKAEQEAVAWVNGIK